MNKKHIIAISIIAILLIASISSYYIFFYEKEDDYSIYQLFQLKSFKEQTWEDNTDYSINDKVIEIRNFSLPIIYNASNITIKNFSAVYFESQPDKPLFLNKSQVSEFKIYEWVSFRLSVQHYPKEKPWGKEYSLIHYYVSWLFKRYIDGVQNHIINPINFNINVTNYSDKIIYTFVIVNISNYYPFEKLECQDIMFTIQNQTGPFYYPLDIYNENNEYQGSIWYDLTTDNYINNITENLNISPGQQLQIITQERINDLAIHFFTEWVIYSLIEIT
jgi:hypothetical protein